MFNIHVGIPGVAQSLLNSVIHAGLLKGSGLPHAVSQKFWQTRFRSLINAKMSGAVGDVTAWAVAESAISNMAAYGSVAISHHALLGSADDCFLKRKLLPYADARMARVSEIFASVPLRFHLTILSQCDYHSMIQKRVPADQTFPELRNLPSWSSLVQRIRAAAPGREILVWDFGQPEKVALAFLSSLLGTEDEDMVKMLGRHLLAVLKESQSSMIGRETPGAPPDLMEALDLQYELDVQALNQMEGVSLITSDIVPEEFYL